MPWMVIDNCVWDMSLCAPSRVTMMTGLRWQRHGVAIDSLGVQDGSTYPYAYHGSQTLNGGVAPPTPQQIYSSPSSPGTFISTWDWRKSWLWALQQVGYQTVWFGKVFNSWPCLMGDTFLPSVSGRNVMDRAFIILDDKATNDQTDATNNCYVTGQPYSGVNHTLHTEANYLATASAPFFFNDNGSTAGNPVNPAGGDAWNTSAYVGSAGYSTRQSGAATGHLTDFWNRKVRQWLQATSGSPDSAGSWPKPPFCIYLAPRGNHRGWVPTQRHWQVMPTATSCYSLGTTDHALAPGATTLVWSAEPSLTNRSTANGAYVMVGMEVLQITAGIGTGTWTISRDVLGNLASCMPQVTTMPTWPSGTPILQISSSLTPDTGDDPSFAEADMSDKSPYWRAANPALNTLACVQARHDRVMKAKCGFSTDEYLYDVVTYCLTFPNPLVVLAISDNGWSYGSHCQEKGKLEPYRLAGVGPLYCYWPDASTAARYPYLSSRPNIVIFVADDDDSQSLVSGFPLLNTSIARHEASTLAWNGDIAATVCDLAGAPPYHTMDGVSLAPYINGALTGKSPRTYVPFAVQTNAENGMPTFNGIQSLTRRYWQTQAYTTPPNLITTGTTAAQVPAGTYAATEEGYDLTVAGQSDELDNFFANAANPGYTPPHTFTAADTATLRTTLSASLLDVVVPTPPPSLALDGSSLTSNWSSASTTNTTPAFSPPANSVIFVAVSVQALSALTISSITNTGTALTWHSLRHDNTTGYGCVDVWWASNPTAQSGITVTVTLSGSNGASGTPGGMNRVLVFTGASATQTGATYIRNFGSSGVWSGSITTSAANSWVWAVAANNNNAPAVTVGSGQTLDVFVPGGGSSCSFWTQYVTATTPVSGTVVTINDTSPSFQGNVVGFEVLHS